MTHYRLPNLPNKLHTATLIEASQGGDNLIAYLARLSAPQNQARMQELSGADDEADKEELRLLTVRLIKQCIRDGHFSILEMANMTVVVKTSLDIAAQMLRHKSLHFQQFSQRYAKVKSGSIEMPELRTAASSSREPSFDGVDYHDLEARAKGLLDACESFYMDAVSRGVAKESARKFLPVQTSTLLAVNGNVRDWFFYLKSRTDEHAQYEHQLVANSVLEIFKDCYPTVALAGAFE